jgi:hypothetical protein
VAQYQTITVTAHPLDLNSAVDKETRNQGRHGWRVENIIPAGEGKTHVQFRKD